MMGIEYEKKVYMKHDSVFSPISKVHKEPENRKSKDECNKKSREL